MYKRWIESMQLHAQAIDSATDFLIHNKDLDCLMNFIKQSKSLFFTGVGKNKDLMYKISKTYNSVSIKSNFIDPIDAVHGDIGMVSDESSIIASSKSGTTAELINFFVKLKQNKNVKIFLLHCNKNIPPEVLNILDYSLYIPIKKEADHLNMIPTVSLAVMEVVLHSCACQIIEDNNFTIEDLYINHPSGNIGDICKMKSRI